MERRLMRVLVTGARGQVGSEVVAAFDNDLERSGPRRGHQISPGRDHEVIGVGREDCDVGDRDAVHQVVGHVRPDVIVHTAAWTDVDGCEGDPDRAFRDNALATRHVAEAARVVGGGVCLLSTDFVFAGDLDRPYTEWDATGPLSVYGRSKLAAEREAGAGALVVRTSWVNGATGRNFVKTMLRLAQQEGGNVDVVDDQWGSPTMAADLAAAVRMLVVGRRTGLFHVTNQGTASWCEVAREVFDAAGHDPGRVRAVTTAQLRPARPAPRPRYSVLDNAAMRLSGLPLLDDWRPALRRLVKDLSVTGVAR